MKRPAELFCLMIFILFMFAYAGRVDCFAMGETSRSDYQVTGGITESTVYVTVDAGYNVRTHILRIAPHMGVGFKVSYGGYYGEDAGAEVRKDKVESWDDKDWTFETVRDQVSAYEKTPDTKGTVIAATNGDFFDVKTGEPEDSLVMEGRIIKKNTKKPFFAVLKNGDVVIRKAGANYSDVAEAVGGRALLLWEGKATGESDGLRNPRQAIGICEDGTVVMVNVDGREPASAGVSMQELAEIMKAQGCVSALNLDGGGSASFLTRRAGEGEIQFRSNTSDGSERRVASALLVIGSDSKKSYKENTVKMESAGTQLKRDRDGTYLYTINNKGQTGFYAVNGESYLFSSGRGVSSEIIIGTYSYFFDNGRLECSFDSDAGNVIIGYCGGSKSGKNLIYAYHNGDKLLNIGINPRNKSKNGRMRDWTSDTVHDIPWYAVRADIKRVYLANGVTNIGSYFLYSAKGSMTGGADAPICQLSKVRLPSSLKEIGAYSLYNKPKLAGVTIPSKVKKIGKAALRCSGNGTLSFKGKTPPSFGSMALKSTGFTTMKIKKSESWTKFIKQKRFKKYGYKKTVKYIK